ncbi:ATPase, P-type (transporting), HAD superfamily, subfamily IC [Methanobacterium lacus]|uniref:ATPase, P-type (Transporting), HAD superfamily, subfamily IC n=1 Tax=Methanobacterium lacus (strain AL-21) TaxID=877455 RepID=F0T8T6_METLA|nr:cation-transporting P-type ATPase [Methanobacterium lacus]ADZ09764.1 ATPase, P-type (transporting), HAD superfamily, subfamily IC [Methanobacterium lacus]
MKIKTLAPEDVYNELSTSKNGLNPDEVENRLIKYGLNQIQEVKQKPLILKFVANLYQLLALLLWGASILAFISGTPQLGFAIIAVIIINAIFSFWQEFEAEKAVDALKKILPSSSKVIRQGSVVEVLSSQLVPGDVLVLEEGNNISADARLVEAYQMKVDSSTLTGESKPVRKVSDPEGNGDENIVNSHNLVLAGTNVSSGSGRAVIFSTGVNTEFNKIASLTLDVKEEPSPLQKQLARLTQLIALIAVLMGVTLFFLNIYVVKLSLSVAFLFAIGLTVANVPEGLLPTVTLALAASVKKMVGKNALIKRLSSVETLGSTNIICTDKTGTLTKNQMTVRKVWIPYDVIDVTGAGYDPAGEFLQGGGQVCHKDVLELKLLMRSATFANDAKLVPPEKPGDNWKIYGDPTEASLLVAAQKNGFDWEAELAKYPRIYELPFDSQRKSMSSIHMVDNRKVAYIKGAPKKIIKLCNEISVEEKPIRFTEEEKKKVVAEHDRLAASGLRILGMAYRNLPSDFEDYDPDTVEKDMIFLGMIAMQDPPRPEVLPAVRDCHKAGIRIIMITGDYGLTARSIAHEVDIVGDENCRIVKGKELTEMDDEELKKLLQSGDDIIFARAVPEHKMRIASVLEDMDEIVAMTGDGVNDAPALRKADIGVAMGITGTDVAKEASDMVLTDDNFATIVSAIKEGRTIFENIRKFITYIFAHETAEIIPFILLVIFKIPLPITVMQILAIDLGTDTLPALALGMGPSESDVMDRPPRPRNERLLNWGVIWRGYIFLGLIEALLVMSGYFWVLYGGGWSLGESLPFTDPLYLEATTMVFVGIVTSQIGNLIGCQTTRTSTFKVGIFKNKWIMRGIIFEVAVMLSIVYVPYLQSIFGTTALDIYQWLYVITFIPIMFFAEELRKYVVRRINR